METSNPSLSAESAEKETQASVRNPDNQALPIGGNNCTSRSVILPNVHTFALDRLYGRQGLLQGWKQRTAVDPRSGCRRNNRDFKGNRGPSQCYGIINHNLTRYRLHTETEPGLKIHQQHHALFGFL